MITLSYAVREVNAFSCYTIDSVGIISSVVNLTYSQLANLLCESFMMFAFLNVIKDISGDHIHTLDCFLVCDIWHLIYLKKLSHHEKMLHQ